MEDWLLSPKILQQASAEEDICWVGNFECAISQTPVDTPEKAYHLVLPESAWEWVVRSPFRALNLANNHSADAGVKALERLVRRLMDETTIQPYGLTFLPFARLQVGRYRCAVIGCAERGYPPNRMLLPLDAVEREIARIRPNADRVFITPHWGYEGEFAGHPSPRQRKLARHWIEAGADGIFGHHAHSIHGVETIRAKPVWFSLGNFDFDHVEGAKHPLSGLGLTVDYSVAEHDSWVYQFIWHHELMPFSAALQPRAEKYLHEISKDFKGVCGWPTRKWLRSVGPRYIRKSDSSWRNRLRRTPLPGVIVKWMLWNLLPKTLLMRMACLCTEAAPLTTVREFEESLAPMWPRK
ncbi:CapA family protein [Syntrophobacter fumaroxidans]|uniref:Enzyme of poly-gamma-glutamate biosynthesis (Capsule formation)-like n=1 Tax=Syntrophobacter fumaroxidans (strain DSM 10017 / MPOB) TaxID=335543 RepID=A0LNK4_SYNFM|nr:CapA family protein [Syntrophobacter fumaroxidans]ABK19006.1 Putative enzyme of poly-gamma-glutamate biosynthesis (capsule formation)-like [Syntrophobacter fumaroxidans MPOB]